MRKALLLFLLTFLSFGTLQAQSIVINKVWNGSNDADGNTDAVELLVIQDHLDIRGFIVKDFDTNANPEGGRFEFRDAPLWSDLRSGTTIVLRNIKSPLAGYAEDTDASDFTIDILMQNATYLTNRGGVAPFNLTSTDMVMVKTGTPTGTENAIHAFAFGNTSSLAALNHFNATTSPKLWVTYTTSGGYFYYPLNPDQNISDYNGQKAAANNTLTNANDALRQWGYGYEAGNRNYIASLRRPVVQASPLNLPVVVNKIYNATDLINGESDAVELLVVQDHFDMRNLIVKDFENNLLSDAGGKYQFNNIDFWSDLRAGTTIVLRKTKSQDAAYVEDTNAADFTLDLLLTTTSPYVTKVSASGQEFNLTMTDMVLIKRGDMNGAGNTIHALVSNGGNAATAGSFFNAVYSRNLVTAAGNGTGFFAFPSNPTTSLADYDGLKAQVSNGTDRGWGIGSGENNQTYIASLRPAPAPAAPSGLTATAFSSSQINLSWTDNASTETGFEIDRSADGTTFTLLATPAAGVSTYEDKALAAHTRYYYRVRAIGGTANSTYTATAEATTLEAAPMAPADLAAITVSSSAITLTWTDNSGNETGFEIEQSLDGTLFTALASVGANVVSYSPTNLSASTRYYFRVRATGVGGASAYTAVAQATTQAGAVLAPGGLTATALSTSGINISWTDNSGNETGFEIERSMDGVAYTRVATAAANATGYADNGLQSSTTYYYRVRATGSESNSAYSNTADATTREALPADPANLAAAAVSHDQVNLSWLDQSGNEASFEIEWSADGSTFALLAAVNPNTTAYAHTGLAPNTTYHYRVRAKAAPGYSGYSNMARATTTSGIPAVPTNLTASSASPSQINLTWTDNAAIETGYQVERSADGTNFSALATLNPNVTAYANTGLAGSTRYYYRVRAIGPVANSAYSNVADATTAAPLPVPVVVVNKIYNATSVFEGTSDAIELLVIKDHADLRNLIVKDLEANATSDNGGKYQFDNIPFWQDMRAGTTIVLRKTAAQEAAYVQDLDASDFTLDLLLNDNATVLKRVSPNGHEFNITNTDIVILKTGDKYGTDNVIHAFATNNGGNTPIFAAITAPMLVSPRITNTLAFQYPLNPEKSGADYTGVKATDTFATDRGWGIGSGQNNIDYIASLRAAVLLVAPSGLTSTAVSETQVDLRWTDNAHTETGFEVERSLDGTSFTLLTTLEANKTTYTDNSVAGGNQYFYRVRAAGALALSAYSNTAGASTNIARVDAIALAPRTLPETAAAGTEAGTFSSTSSNASATFTYSLTSGAGDTDNALFAISGNKLQTAGALNYETKPSLSLRVRSTSSSGHFREEIVTLAVQDVNEAPTLAAIAAQTVCSTTAEQAVALTQVTAGPEMAQTLTLRVTSPQMDLFDALAVSPAAAGTAQVTYRLKAGARGTATVTVVVQDNGGTANGGTDAFSQTFTINSVALPDLAISAGQGGPLSKGLSTTLTASGGVRYAWADAEGILSGQNSATLLIRPEKTTTYQVTATNESGCPITQAITIEVSDNYSVLETANLLSPNNDGVNDKWVIQHIDFYRNNEVKVFDGAGRLVFSQKGYNNTWDGTYRNAPLAEGTYYYIVDFGNGQPTFKGFITIVRQ